MATLTELPSGNVQAHVRRVGFPRYTRVGSRAVIEAWVAQLEQAIALETRLAKAEGRKPDPARLPTALLPTTGTAHRHPTLREYVQSPDFRGRMVKSQWLFWDAQIGGMLLRDIERKHIKDGLNKLRESGKAPATVGQYLAWIRSALSHAVDEQHIPLNVAKDRSLVPPKPRKSSGTKALTKAEQREFMRALEAVNAETHRAAQIMLSSAARLSEVLGLTWGDLKPGKTEGSWSAELRETKNGGSRILHIRGVARPAGVSDDAPVVDRWRRGVQLDFERATKISGVKASPHSLRHSAITAAAEAGVAAAELQKFSGHKSLAALQIYLHLDDAQIGSRVADRLAESRADRP